jgi:hypothetical protein
MASAPIYCTHKELKRVFPQLDEYDQKTPIYGWTELFSHGGFKLYESFDSGLTTVLFQDGEDLTAYQKTENYTDSTANTDEAVDIIETAIDVTDGSVFGYGDIIKIDDEKMLVTNISSNTLTVKRGFLGTTTATHNTGVDVYIGVEWSEAKQWLYSSGENSILLYEANSTDPSDLLIESGEDFTTMVTQFRTDASRYIDSRLDPKLPKNQLKDKNGNFDYMIVRTTALYAAAFMMKTKDPTSDMAAALMLEADNNVQLLNEGRAALSWQNTGDASQGVLRDVTYTDGQIRPVDFRGRAVAVDYDLIKVKIGTGGAIGTATYNVWIKDSNGLKQNQVVSDEKITGDYQNLAHGLEIRFAGTTDSSEATANNEWEVEVRGYSEEVDAADLRGIKMTRRRYYGGRY